MKKKIMPCLAFGLMLLILSGNIYAATYNAVDEFSITNGNPNGVWSYGEKLYNATHDSFGDFEIFQYGINDGGWARWHTNNLPSIGQNISAWTAEGIPSGGMNLHSYGDNAAVLRFTTPEDGIYDIIGGFLSGNTGTPKVAVTDDSGFLWKNSDSGDFSFLNHSLASGTIIDFVVYDWTFAAATGLNLTIEKVETSSVPIPSTFMLFSACMLFLPCTRIRRKK